MSVLKSKEKGVKLTGLPPLCCPLILEHLSSHYVWDQQELIGIGIGFFMSPKAPFRRHKKSTFQSSFQSLFQSLFQNWPEHWLLLWNKLWNELWNKLFFMSSKLRSTALITSAPYWAIIATRNGTSWPMHHWIIIKNIK